MAVSKVVYDNKTIIDLTGDTVTRSSLAYGTTAHNAAGNQIVGSLIMDGSEMDTSDFVRNGGNEDVVLHGNITVDPGKFLLVEEISKTFSSTIASNDSFTSVLNVAKSGWTPLGVVGWASGSTLLNITRVRISGTEVTFAGRNISSSNTSNYTLRAQVLYLRTGS